jgi:hypothetical protein
MNKFQSQKTIVRIMACMLILTLLVSLNIGLHTSSGYATKTIEPSLPEQGNTPYTTALIEAINARKAEGLPIPSLVTYDLQSSSSGTRNRSAFASTSPTTVVAATTIIYFDGPEQAGYEEWPALVVEDIVPADASGMIAEGDYTEFARTAIESQLPDIWQKYEFGQEPRKHTITETYVLHPSNAPMASDTQITAASKPEHILMGFTYTGPKIDYAIENNTEVCAFDECVTIYRFKAGYQLDWALGLRLPAEVKLFGQEQMEQGNSYNLTTSLHALNWSASQYLDAGVAPEGGNEFVLRLNFLVSVEGELLGNDLCYGCKVTLNQDQSASFVTPFGSSASFPIPSANIPIHSWNLNLFEFSVGLQIDPDLGSSMVKAKWSAVPGSDCVGNGTVIYTEPGVPVFFGPVTACIQGSTNQAQIEVSDFEYWFNEFLVTIRAILDFKLFGYGVWHEEPKIVSFDLSPLTNNMFVSDHIQCDSGFKCKEAGPENRLIFSSTVLDETPPITTPTLAGTVGDNGWWVSDVQITLNAVEVPIVDSLKCGSGVDFTEYSFDGITWNTYSGRFTLVREGVTTLFYRSTDNKGNVEVSKLQAIMVDKTPPIITGATNTPPNNYGWWNNDVIVRFEATDTISGSPLLHQM